MGREMINDIVDTEIGVSRRHAEIIETDTGHYLRELFSSHGTFANGNRIWGPPVSDRILAFVEGASHRLQTRNLRDLALEFPELEDLPQIDFHGARAVLDYRLEAMPA